MSLIRLIAGLGLLGLFVAGSWAGVDFLVKETGDETFCAGCHSMKPMAEAYREDRHGGNNAGGTRAACVDCHLPHNNPVNYLYRKAMIGMHDVWAELTYDLDSIDWEGMRDHREDYTYDSGCLNCHSNLEKAGQQNTKMFVAHKPYFLGQTEKRCVSCHKHVGHKDLGNKLASLRKDKEEQR